MSFDNYAAQWDTEIRIERAKYISEEIGKSLCKSKYKNSMEFGCGTGLISFNLINRFEKMTLVDVSPKMINIVEEKIKAFNIKSAIGLTVDLLKDEIEGSGFDLIYSSMVLHHIPDTKEILKRLYDLLNEDGELYIVDIDEEDGRFHKKYSEFNGHNGFRHDELMGKLEDVGYRNNEIQSFYFDEKEIEGEKVKYSLFILRAYK